MTLDQMSRGLAAAFLAGPWSEGSMVARGCEALGLRRPPRWLRPLVQRLLLARPLPPPPDGDEQVAALLRDDQGFRVVRAGEGGASLRLRRWLLPEPAMVPVAGPPASFAILPLAAEGDLANALGLAPAELDWFADRRGLNPQARVDALAHYRYRWVPKARGGHRLLEAPKLRLKQLQRALLRQVLAPIPVSDRAHGFVRGRDVRSFVAPHVGQAVVVRLDLEDFFASVSRARVVALFRRVGYPRRVALALAGLCTAATPEHVLAAHPRSPSDDGAALARRFAANQRLRAPHLAQGAPTSPALANLAAWRLDRRLAALAASFGATMTRYADDIAFAGDPTFARSLPFFLPRAAAIALEEGFSVNHRKTRVMRRSRRQHLCGLVVNARPNVARGERDRLRALLFNAARFGPASQNRDGHPDFRRHVEGRIAWVAAVNPAAGARLRALLARVPWQDAGEAR